SKHDVYDYDLSLQHLLAGPFGLTRIDTNVSTLCVQGYAKDGHTKVLTIQEAAGIRTTPTDLTNFFGKFLSYTATTQLFPTFATEQALLATSAMSFPNTHSNWSLGCWGKDTASQTITTFNKN